MSADVAIFGGEADVILFKVKCLHVSRPDLVPPHLLRLPCRHAILLCPLVSVIVEIVPVIREIQK